MEGLASVRELRGEPPRIGDDAGDRRRRRGEWTGEQRAASRSLPPFEVAVAGGNPQLAGTKRIAIHRDAHRAAGLPPFGARLDENAVEPLAFGLTLHLLESRHDETAHARAKATP